MNEHDLLERIQLLEYHQKLLLKLLSNQELRFYRLIIERGISEHEVNRLFKLCEDMCQQIEEQKEEGFVYFYPLFQKFSKCLPDRLKTEEVIQAFLSQNLFEPLMKEFRKYISY